jgi:hypothetical protein
MSGTVDLKDNCVGLGVVTGDATTPVFQTPGARGFLPTITRLAAGDYRITTSPVRDFDSLFFEVSTRSLGGGTGPVNATVLDDNATVAGAFRVLMKDSAATPTAVDADFSIVAFQIPGT